MKKSNGNKVLLNRNSSSIGVAIFMLIAHALLLIISILKNQIIFSIIFLLGILFLLFIIWRIKTIIFYEEGITVQRYWTKKEIWSCKYSEIKKVKASYFSDTFYRSKSFEIVMKTGIIKKIILVHVMMEIVAKVFYKYEIPIDVEKNDVFVPYKPN